MFLQASTVQQTTWTIRQLTAPFIFKKLKTAQASALLTETIQTAQERKSIGNVTASTLLHIMLISSLGKHREEANLSATRNFSCYIMVQDGICLIDFTI
jgi:hypothetical protein